MLIIISPVVGGGGGVGGSRDRHRTSGFGDADER